MIEHLAQMYHGNWWTHGGWMWVLWLGVLVIIAVGLYHLIKRSKPPEEGSAEDSLEILRRRYARGEISRADFERMKEDLRA